MSKSSVSPLASVACCNNASKLSSREARHIFLKRSETWLRKCSWTFCCLRPYCASMVRDDEPVASR